MDDDDAGEVIAAIVQKPGRLLAAAIAVTIIAVLLLAIDLGIKRELLAESSRLREAIRRERDRQDGTGPGGRGQAAAGSGDAVAGVLAVDDLADDPQAPAPATENAGAADGEDGKREVRPPRRGSGNAS